jgi:SAM-dependent methyltransferase
MPELVDRSVLAPTGEASTPWPPVVRAELLERRRRVEALPEVTGGRVLDLSEPASLHRVLAAGRGSSEDPGTDRFDVVVSVAALVAVADLPLALRGVERVLDPDGRFLFVEPVTHPGWAGILAASAGSLLAPVRHQHLGRDVPLAVRQAGFIITDLERITMSTSVWPLRSFVDGCGRPRTGFAGR